MRYLRTVFLVSMVIMALDSYSQEPIYTPMRSNYKFRGIRIDSLFMMPSFPDTTTANALDLANINGNFIRIDTSLYVRYNQKWYLINGGGGGAGSIPNLQQVTTAGNTTTTHIQITDDLRIRNSINGTIGRIIAQGEITQNRSYNLPDTTGRLVISVNGNIADSKGNISISATDTTSLSNRINAKADTSAVNLKLNISDTANKWVNRLERISGKDSIIYYIGSNRYAIKDSVGNTSGFVPYTGATQDVDLGANKISAASVYVTGTNGNGHIHLKHQNGDATATGQSTSLYADNRGDLKWKNDGDYYTTLRTQQTNNRVYTFQNKSYTLGDSADISTRLLISDTSAMLGAYLRKIDTASLSNQINAKVNLSDSNIVFATRHRVDTMRTNVYGAINTKIGGAGTTGSLAEFTASGTIGNASVDVDYLQQDMSLVAMQAMGSSIKGYNIGAPIPTALAAAFTMTSQQLFIAAIYVPKSVTLTGVRWFQVTNGSFTANNYNGVALYTVSGGTLTLVDSSTRDGNCWQQGTGWRNKDFVTPYSASAGIYYVGVLYSSSAQTTAPAIGTSGSTSGTYNGNTSFDFTNSQRAGGTLASQTALPTSQALSGTSTNGHRIGVYLY